MNRRMDRNWDSDVVRYPDPAIEVIDPRFARYVIGNCAVERLYTGCRWAEGPVWFGDQRCLIWSDIPNNRMLCWDEETGVTSVFRKPSNNSNGNTRDGQGRLITCEHDSRRVTRTEHDGTISVLMDSFPSTGSGQAKGKPLNAPNDVVVHPDGCVWFTDPGYGILLNYEGHVAQMELPTNVYRLNPETGAATVVTSALEKPNGLCFSPDYSKLYVSDTGASHKPGHPKQIHVWDVVEGARLANGRVFYDMGAAASDGFRCDTDGNIWTSAGWAGEGSDGVHIIAPDGTLIGKIHLPEPVANLCFGGVKKNRLFIAASQSVYAVYVEAVGAQRP